jgi:hypothetical protein
VSELSPGELLVFLQLVLFALIVRVVLTSIALPRISAFIAYAAKNALLRNLPLFHHSHGISRLTRVADLAARGTRADGPCLIRSLLLFWLLKVRGEHAELLIGVRKDGPIFNSHAWIESDGKILGENEDGPLRFSTLLRF